MANINYPKQNVGFLLRDVTRLMRRNFLRHADDFGLTYAQMQALAYVAWADGLRQVALADMLEIQPITTTRLVDKLVEEGLVERCPDPDDRRACQLFITDKAKPLLDQLYVVAAAARKEAMTGITAEMQEMLMSILQQMHGNLLAIEQGSKTEKPEAPDSTSVSAKPKKNP